MIDVHDTGNTGGLCQNSQLRLSRPGRCFIILATSASFKNANNSISASNFDHTTRFDKYFDRAIDVS